MNSNTPPEQNDLNQRAQQFAEERARNRALKSEKRRIAIENRNLFIAKKSELYNIESDTHFKNNNTEKASKKSSVLEKSDVQQQNTTSASGNPVKSKKKANRKSSNFPATLFAALSLFVSTVLILSISLGLVPVVGNSSNTSSEINISSRPNRPSSGSDTGSPADMLEGFLDSVVIINADGSTGTGIIATESGYIITNYHVIEDAKSINVKFYNDPTAVSATVVGFSKIDDIAVIKVEKSNLKAATFAKSSECRIGEKVYAVGTPEGDNFGWSVTQGIISCTNREIMIYDDEGILEKKMYVIQTDASVNPGNSGGPLINEYGEVLGIITLKLSQSAGMGFAIPSDGAVELVQAIIKDGNANNVNSSVTSGRPLIGITGANVEGNNWYQIVISAGGGTSFIPSNEAYATAHPDTTFYAPESGIYVFEINPLLDASKKLKIGDIITEANGIRVTNIYQLMDIINKLNGGDTVSVKYYRDGSYNTVDIILGTLNN